MITPTAPVYDFDTVIERRGTDCAKWHMYPDDVLPLWVADMDFPVAAPILNALHARVDHAIFGYQFDSKALREVITQRMQQLYNWAIQPEEVVFLPNLVSALFMVGRVYAQPNDQILVQTPVYPPFLGAPAAHQQTAVAAPLAYHRDGSRLHYDIDFEAFEAAITPQTRLFMLCNPHNPVGRVFTRDELTRMAEICQKHDLLIVSDEIHCDLLMDAQHQHLPIASLSPEISQRTVTLMAPNKTFNLAGLSCAYAIVQNADLRAKLSAITWGLLPFPSTVSFTAAHAAYSEGQAWLEAALTYLRANRDFVSHYIAVHFPKIAATHPEGTYMTWLDCRDLGLSDPHKFFLETAKVALNDGRTFGKEGEGFVRLNFACPRSTLTQALDRMRIALNAV